MKTIFSRSGLALLLVLGTGCARYAPQPLDPAASAARLMNERLGARRWTLAQLQARAEATLPEVTLARAQYETARAAVRTAGERPNPTVSISPQAPVQLRHFFTGTYAIDFDWTVETMGKRSRRLEIAHAGQRAAAEHLVEAVWKARAAVRKAFLDLYAAEERGRLLQQAVASQAELLTLLDRRIEAGAEARSVSSQPRLLQAQLRLQSAEAARQGALARASLAETLGLSVTGLAGAGFSFAEFERAPRLPADHRRAALTHRAAIAAALAEYASAESALRLEIARQYPDLHLNPGYQLDDNDHKWSLGVGLTLPILNQNQGAISEAESRRREAAARFQVVQAKVLAECDHAWVSLKASRGKLAVAEALLAEGERQAAGEQRLVTAGAGDQITLRTAAVEQALNRSARLDAWVEYQTALGELELATGTALP